MNVERKQIPLKARLAAVATLGSAAFITACSSGDNNGGEVQPSAIPSETPESTKTIKPTPSPVVETSPTLEDETNKEGIVNFEGWEIAIKKWEEEDSETNIAGKTVLIEAQFTNVSDEVKLTDVFLDLSRFEIRYENQFGEAVSYGDLYYLGSEPRWAPDPLEVPPHFGLPVKLIFLQGYLLNKDQENYSFHVAKKIDYKEILSEGIKRGEVARDIVQIPLDLKLKNPGETGALTNYAMVSLDEGYIVNSEQPFLDRWATKQFLSFDIQNNSVQDIDLGPASGGDLSILVYLKDGRVVPAGATSTIRGVPEDVFPRIESGLKKTVDVEIGRIFEYNGQAAGEVFPLGGATIVVMMGDRYPSSEFTFVGAWRIPE